MTPRPESTTRQTEDSIWWAATIIVLLGALGVYGLSAASWPETLASAAIGVVAMLLVPRNALPAAALWLLVLLPVGYMYIPKVFGQYFAPPVFVIAIWMLRIAFAHGMLPLLRIPVRGWLIIGPFFVLLLASALNSVLLGQTLGWIAVFTICVIAPAVLGQVCLDDVWPTVRRTFAGIGLFLGVVAAVEFVFHFNPWSDLYRYEVATRAAVFSVFRAFTSLGHPLMTSLVASVALVICVFPIGAIRRWPYWICAGGAVVALVLSVSRSGVIAVGCAVIVGVLSGLGGSRRAAAGRHGRLIAVLASVTLSAILAWSPLLKRRSESTESITSATYRTIGVDKAMTLVGERPMLGFGPGTSPWVFNDRFRGPLENSALQLLVSLGIPATLLIAIGFGAIVAVAMRRSRVGAAAGIVAFLVSASGCNLVDGGPSTLAFITPLIVCAVMPKHGLLDQDDGILELRSWADDRRNRPVFPRSAK